MWYLVAFILGFWWGLIYKPRAEGEDYLKCHRCGGEIHINGYHDCKAVPWKT